MLNIKKTFSIAVTYFVLELIAANTALAADEVTISNPLGNKTLEQIIQGVVNFIFGLALLICPIFIVWGGFEIATANGAEAKIKEGRQKITYSLVGLVIIALASTFVAVIKSILGVS